MGFVVGKGRGSGMFKRESVGERVAFVVQKALTACPLFCANDLFSLYPIHNLLLLSVNRMYFTRRFVPVVDLPFTTIVRQIKKEAGLLPPF
jgi:hypothetical protein